MRQQFAINTQLMLSGERRKAYEPKQEKETAMFHGAYACWIMAFACWIRMMAM